MYLNKLLFPAPSGKYKVEDLEKNLIYIPRERYTKKKFKISKIRSASSDSAKNETKRSLFSTLFHKIGFKTKNKQKRSQSGDETPKKDYELKNQSKNIQSQAAYENRSQNIVSPHDIPNIITSKSQGSPKPDDNCDIFQLKKGFSVESSETIKQYEDANDINPERKKKKKKNACFGFSFKQQNKKFNLELFDGTHEPDGGQISDPKDLKHLNAGIIDQILSSSKKKIEDPIDKESSSDSEDEEHEHTHHIIMNGNKIILKKVIFIPCIYLESPKKTRKTMIYFHANGEDLNQAMEFALNINKNLLINVLAIEYPGYGIYKGSPSERKICMDAETVYDCLKNNVGIDEKDIFLFGRSIGTGPAIWLASIKNPGLLVLMSAFSSIKHVAKHLVGKVGGYFIKQRFRNYKRINQVMCPLFLIHGKQDTMIPFKQSAELYNAAKVEQKELHLSEKMTHQDYDYILDVGGPLLQFLKKHKLLEEKSQDQIHRPDFGFLKTPNYEPLLEKYKNKNSNQTISPKK